MLARMSSAEVTDWQAYEQVTGPLGAERHDILATMVASYVVTALGAKHTRLDRMLPRWDRPRQDWRQQQALLKTLTVAAGGEVVDGSEGAKR